MRLGFRESMWPDYQSDTVGIKKRVARLFVCYCVASLQVGRWEIVANQKRMSGSSLRSQPDLHTFLSGSKNVR